MARCSPQLSRSKTYMTRSMMDEDDDDIYAPEDSKSEVNVAGDNAPVKDEVMQEAGAGDEDDDEEDEDSARARPALWSGRG